MTGRRDKVSNDCPLRTDRPSHIGSAESDAAQLRKLCQLGTEAYRLALLNAGYRVEAVTE